jgi:hypothetical protein
MHSSLAASTLFLLLAACADPAHTSTPTLGHTGTATLHPASPSGSAQRFAARSLTFAGLGEGAFQIVGDLNGDGFDDIVAIDATTGGAAVYDGHPPGPSTTPSRALTVTLGENATVVGVGDVNGDGYEDFVLGDPTSSGDAGRLLVYHGSRLGVSKRPTQTIRGREAATLLGSELARLGDVNGDGYDDVGVTLQSGQAVRVYLGSTSGLRATDYTTVSATYHPAPDIAGYVVDGTTGGGISGGDTNGDGYGDLVVGYSQWNTEDGGFYTFLGSASGLSATGDLLTYPYPGAYTSWCDGPPYMGWALDAHGDFDGDGYDDVVASAPADACDGFVYVWYGSASGPQFARWSEQYGYSVGVTGLGFSVGVGDLNGDGYDDAGFGGETASYAEGPLRDSSRASEHIQNVTPISGTTAWHRRYTYEPSKVRGQGDVNGDGYDDLLVGVNTGSGTWDLLLEYGAP